MKKLSVSMFIVLTISAFGLFTNANKASAQYSVQTCNSATLNGYVDPNGNPTSAWFEWGPTSSLGFSTTPHTYTSYSTFSAEINGLSPNTTYYYNTYFSNSVTQGIWAGTGPISFTTASCQTTPVNPTVSLTANPTSVAYNGTSTLNWTSSNATSCIATGGTNGWNGNQSTSGNFYTGALTNTTTYGITCTSSTGQQASSSATVYVTPQQVQNPTVSLYASPTSIQAGANSTLTWSSQNATYCNAYWTSSSATSGSGIVVPGTTTTYTITCYGTNGAQAQATATVSVTQAQNPTVSLTANPTSVIYGGTSTLTWNSTGATSCIASGGTNGWGGAQNTSGNFNTGALTNTTSYNITCSNNSGAQASAYATVSVGTQQVQNPTVSLYASPTSIQAGANSTLTWSSQNATYCNAYWTSSSATSGSGIVVPGTTTTYTITCYGTNGAQAQATATVSVTQAQTQSPTVTLVANPSSVAYDGTSILAWNSTNATSCIASSGINGWSGNQNTSGSFSTGALTYTTSYNITCTNSAGASASAYATVSVNTQTLQPTVNIYANPATVNYNNSSVISWNSTNANYCNLTGGANGLNGSQSTSGSLNTGPLTYTTTYNITCTSSTGQQANSSAIIYVNQNNYQPIVYQQPVYQAPVVYQQPIVNNSLNVVTTQATQVLDESAQLNSLISSSATSPINAWFEWGPTINLGNTTTTTAVGTLPSVIHTDTLSGLNPGTTYYYRAYAQDSYQSVHGSILSFTTTGTQNPITITHYINRTVGNSLVLITSSVNRDQPIVPTIDNTRPHPGDEINYAVNYQNVGTSSATNLSLQLVLPQEVTYLSSNPSNPNILGNTLIFNLGTLRSGASGVVTVKTQVNSDATAGTLLNFPATLNYVDASGQPQSVSANITAQIWSATTGTTSSLGAFAFGAGFFPGNVFGWLLLLILILVLILLAKYIYGQRRINPAYSAAPLPLPPYVKRTTTVVDHQPLGKKTTTTTVEQ